MVNSIELRTTAGTIKIERASPKWARLFFLDGAEAVFIGENEAKVVANRILEYLDPLTSMENVGKIEGKPVAWIMSNEVTHHSIYGTIAPQFPKELFLQDRHARILKFMVIQPEAEAEWKARIIEMKAW